MKYTRKNRRSNRKASRKSRRGTRRSQRGGWVVLNPAGVNENSMLEASKQNLAQGGEYAKLHEGQHGGAMSLDGAPVGYTGVLDSSLRTAAHLGPLDRSFAGIQGMSDQAGGARRKGRKGRKGRKASRKGRKASRKGRKASRKGRRSSRRVNSMMRRVMRMLRRRRGMRGGAALNPADYNAPGTLLPAGLEKAAVGQMNPEWKLAEDPKAFAPQM